VVLLPLMAVITVLVAARRSWRHVTGRVAVLDGLLVLASLAAKQSGQALQRRLSSLNPGGALVAADHGRKGSLLPLFALALFAAAVVVWYATRRPRLAAAATVLAAVAALAAIRLDRRGRRLRSPRSVGSADRLDQQTVTRRSGDPAT
jgi:hypothetical protein